jgi:hypothetical protein
MQLAYCGRLIILLDGWNELSADGLVRAERMLGALRRDYPSLGVVIATRLQSLPIAGVVVEVEAFTEHQQLELAKKLRGQDGEVLIDRAWRTAGVAELISIPLYLNALVASTPGSALPDTKEAILNMFIAQHEKTPGKAAVLRRDLLGFHTHFLTGLAEAANRAGTTTLSDEEARTAICSVMTTLQANHQLTSLLQPNDVLDTLVNSHSLVRSGSGSGSVSFQHQQFQEWYASFEVERLIQIAASGKPDAWHSVNTEVFNWVKWEESILFACERLSRKNADGIEVVAAAVLNAIGIAPMLAAEMIGRSAPEVWARIGRQVTDFVKRWHSPGTVDRAVRFMITSGRGEFAEQIWPLIANSDDQTYFQALRSARRFRPSVLGPDAEQRIAALPEDIRSDVLGELCMNGGFEGIELAARLAKIDTSTKVVIGVVQALQFRRADRHIASILETASADVWAYVASDGYPNTLSDENLNARLAEMRRALLASENDATQVIQYLTGGKHVELATEGIAEDRIASIIQSPEFPVDENRARGAVQTAFSLYPNAVAGAILHRIAHGLAVPYGSEELLGQVFSVDDGPVAAAVLDGAIPVSSLRAACTVVGPITVGRLIDALVLLDDEWRANGRQLTEAARQEYMRVTEAIRATRQTSLLPALLSRAKVDQPHRIRMMADLLARHGNSHEREPINVSEDLHAQLSQVLEHWIEIMLTSSDANRHQFADVVRAIECLPESQFVPGLKVMLERDLADWARARHEHRKSGGGILSADVTHNHGGAYRRAFAAIGDAAVVDLMKVYLRDLEFGDDAALVLLDIWNRKHPSDKEHRLSIGNDFSDVKARQALASGATQAPTSDFAEAIFEVVRDLGVFDGDLSTLRHAFRLAVIGLKMPHGTKRAEIDSLLKLPQSFAVKRDLFRTAAMVGEVMSAEMLIAAVHELMEAGKQEPWRLEDEQGELMDWVELFAFSDRPMLVLDLLNLLPIEYRHPWRLRRLLNALGQSPHPEALQVLEALAKRDPRMTTEHDWRSAVIRLGTEDSALTVLNMICDGRLNGGKDRMGGWELLHSLASLARTFPGLHKEMLQRYENMLSGSRRDALENALMESVDAPTIVALIRSFTMAGRSLDGRLSRAIEKLALGERPASHWPGAVERFSAPLVELRRQLFAMAVASGAESTLAQQCLNEIEALRDEHGRISDEPNHPDIASGASWPIQAQFIVLDEQICLT